ncbi:palmitoyl-monogalactosyldiacylglycerol delta-7 desaturase, chloroplastic-like isoform X2 [Prunus avium]|uniref:Palmitoyl-monogalactosyldiacylglycerol delta-7 desaturase, chloroplastic-like isoform X2 n=1 Tax=Prunus avium TaxID=42229 RepID=A0A6P5SRL7_PRUAV|nr:palmitoyl-monogalactosyldiacylglycerol delta-7 desaturase, chloroplastic-like isoform X2 [Prunus avium]
MGILVKIVMMPCGEYFGRKWNLLDIVTAAVFLTMHCLCAMAPFHFTWPAFWLAFALYVVTGVGVTLSFHRNLAHRSFRIPKWLEYLFAYFGVLSLQGSPIEWVSSHRYHHQFTDTVKDVHSPLQGFWFSHMGWILDSGSRFGNYGGLKNVEDLKRQAFYRFLHHTFLLHSFLLGALLYAVGGLPFLTWGVGVRMVCLFHSTMLVNSAGHIWGQQVYHTGDTSRNNWWLGLLTFGEGWHNNHHAFDYSARQGFEWWQIDVTWYVIRFLEAIGLATDVKTPTEAQKERKALHHKTMATQN